MPDSQDQARGNGQEADLPATPTNNSQPSPEPTSSSGTSPPPDGSQFEARLDERRKLIGLEAEEAQMRLLASAADFAEAKAEEASHQAAAEPTRQWMTLWERAVELLLVTLLTLAVIVLFIVNPLLIYLGLPVTAVAAWKRFRKRDKGDRKTPLEDEGDP